jgi:hypothetical protein
LECESVDKCRKWSGTRCWLALSATARASPPARTRGATASWTCEAPRALRGGGSAILWEILLFFEKKIKMIFFIILKVKKLFNIKLKYISEVSIGLTMKFKVYINRLKI